MQNDVKTSFDGEFASVDEISGHFQEVSLLMANQAPKEWIKITSRKQIPSI